MQALARLDAMVRMDAAMLAARIDHELLRLLRSLDGAMDVIERWEDIVAYHSATRQPGAGNNAGTSNHATARPSLSRPSASQSSQLSQPSSSQQSQSPYAFGMPYVFGGKEWLQFDRKAPLVGSSHQVKDKDIPSPYISKDDALAPLTTANGPTGVNVKVSTLAGERFCRWKPMPPPMPTAAAAAGEGGADAMVAVAEADPLAAYVAGLPPQVSEEMGLWVLYRSGWSTVLADSRLRGHLKQHRNQPPAERDEMGRDVPPLERLTPSDELIFAQAMQERPKDFAFAARKLNKNTLCCVNYYYSTFKKKHKAAYAVRFTVAWSLWRPCC